MMGSDTTVHNVEVTLKPKTFSVLSAGVAIGLLFFFSLKGKSNSRVLLEAFGFSPNAGPQRVGSYPAFKNSKPRLRRGSEQKSAGVAA